MTFGVQSSNGDSPTKRCATSVSEKVALSLRDRRRDQQGTSISRVTSNQRQTSFVRSRFLSRSDRATFKETLVPQCFVGRPPIDDCTQSRALSANHLLTDLQDRALGNRLNRMSLNARTALSEQGVNVLFVAFGFLKWFEAEHSDEPRLSPLLLVPVCLERIGATAPWKLSLDEDELFLSPSPPPCL